MNSPRLGVGWRPLLPCTLALVALAVTGCKKAPVAPLGGPDASVPDPCNTQDDAVNKPECQLTLGKAIQGYVGAPGDQDWYSVKMPATLDARSLVHVTAGYAVPNTPVDLAVNLLKPDGKTSLEREVDDHGQAKPQPVEIIHSFTTPGAQLFLLLGDEALNPSRPNYDPRAPYSLQVDVLEDPDTHEPNDQTPTPITLSPSGGVSSGTTDGYLSTPNDVDLFSFDVPQGEILYLDVSAPTLSPPPPFRLSYTLLGPDGKPVSEGFVGNQFLAVDLSTARKVTTAGTYTLKVTGYRAPGDSDPIPGDLRLKYTVTVEVLDEADLHEPDDTLAAADSNPVSLGAPGTAGASTSITGRIGYVPDPDWYRFDLPASNVPTLLHYTLTPTSNGGRFPPLAGNVDREVRVFTEVPGGANACLETRDPLTGCPRGDEGNDSLAQLVNGFCQKTPSLCLRSMREEVPKFGGLRNFEGMLPVPAHPGGPLSYYVVVEDQGTNWADDEDYVLTVASLTDPDAANEQAGIQRLPLTTDPGAASFPAPPSGATTVSGTLVAGYGRLSAHDPNVGEGVRGPLDYDAVPTVEDQYQLDFPSGLTPPLDRTWELQWSIENLPDGGRPYDLALELQFCSGEDGGSCIPIADGGSGVLGFKVDPQRSWQNPTAVGDDLQPLYTLAPSGGQSVITAQPYGCFCFERRFVKGGTFRLTIGALDRNSYQSLGYTLHTALTAYPQSYTSNGETVSCPGPVLTAVDAGTLPDGGVVDGGTVYTGGCGLGG